MVVHRLPAAAPGGRGRAPHPEAVGPAPAPRRLHPAKTLETFDFDFNPSIHRQQILHLAECDFVREHRNVILCGPTGTGKSHLAQALGHEACRKGVQALLVDTDKMLKHLHGGRADGSWERRLTTYLRADLLLLDDFGLKPLSPPGPEDLYDVINERYEQGSIILTSNRAPAEWPELFGDPLLASGRTGPPGAPGRGRRHPRRFLPRQGPSQVRKGGAGRHRRRLIRSPQESAASGLLWPKTGGTP